MNVQNIESDVNRLLRDVERLRNVVVRENTDMAEEVDRTIRRADRLLQVTAGSAREGAVRSGRTLLHCLQCGLGRAA